MKFRFRLLLLAALVILVVAGSTAAREETKPQDGGESTDIKAADDGKSKKQKDGVEPDAGKERVKQKWQRHKPPSSKKAKKAALRKEKALGKSGKEKWKTAAEEASKRRTKRSAEHGKEDGHGQQNWAKKEKPWKKNKAEKQQPGKEGKGLNVDKLKKNEQGFKIKGKQAKKDKCKSNKDDSACLKDKLCSNGNEKMADGEKNKWKRKQCSETGAKGMSAELNEAVTTDSEEDPSDGTESVENANVNGRVETKSDENTEEEKHDSVLKQRTTEGNKEAVKPKGAEKKRKLVFPEMEEAPAVQPEGSASRPKSAKIRRYIVEEEVIREDATGDEEAVADEEAVGDEEMPE